MSVQIQQHLMKVPEFLYHIQLTTQIYENIDFLHEITHKTCDELIQFQQSRKNNVANNLNSI